MSYIKQNFKDGQPLYASQLIEIEDALITIEADLNDKQPKGNYAKASDIKTSLSQLTDDANHRTVTDEEKQKWNSGFSGNYNDLTNKPTIPSIDNFATKDYVEQEISEIPAISFSTKQGLDNVARETAKNNIGIYVSTFEPSDAVIGDIWFDTLTSIIKTKTSDSWTTNNSINADTLDGKHADAFALATDLLQIQKLIGNLSVNEQLTILENKIFNTLNNYYTKEEFNNMVLFQKEIFLIQN